MIVEKIKELLLKEDGFFHVTDARGHKTIVIEGPFSSQDKLERHTGKTKNSVTRIVTEYDL
jgi:hypothetical protein